MATVSIYIPAECATFRATNIPELLQTNGTNLPVVGIAFGTANEAAYYRFVAWNYGASAPNISVIYDWYSRSGSTSGTVTWQASIAPLTPLDAQSVLTDTFFSNAIFTATTVSSTASALVRSSISYGGANLDGLAAGDSVVLEVLLSAKTMTGDAVLLGVTVQYSDT